MVKEKKENKLLDELKEFGIKLNKPLPKYLFGFGIATLLIFMESRQGHLLRKIYDKISDKYKEIV